MNKKITNKLSKKIPHSLNRSRLGQKLYIWTSVAILLITSFFWAVWGAQIQQINSDQLVIPYFFDSWHSFNGAYFPLQHSFLFKWPLLYVIKLAGASHATFINTTVFISLLTVSLFVFILYKINSRPFVFGTLCLALGSVLLLVPPAPYAGGLLPTSFAMLTTRNLEYILYILGLWLFIKNCRIKSVLYWVGVGLFSILFASDKLFFSLSVGGAVVGIVVYSIARRWQLVRICCRWLCYGLLSFIGSYIILFMVTQLGITHLVGSGTSPYGLVHSIHSVMLGGVFGSLGILTNFGANPAFDVTVLRNMPTLLYNRLFSLGGLGYFFNLLIFGFGLWTTLLLFVRSLRRDKNMVTDNNDSPYYLSILLILASIAAFGSFIITDHYYPVDARYLTIFLFTLFITTATYLRRTTLSPKVFFAIGGILFVTACLSLVHARNISKNQLGALDKVSTRTTNIVNILKGRHVTRLVGDYWRVIPVRTASKNTILVTPLADCFSESKMLSSEDWQIDKTNTGFAYLLSLDKNLTSYPNCSLDQVLATFGRPNKSSLVSGTIEKPEELLLFYDNGIRPDQSYSNPKPSTVLPTSIHDLERPKCPTNTLLQVVAHEDDDLLFMNPDLQNSISSGQCVRTVYVTAGDGGNDSYYWLGRERGAEDAYGVMLPNTPERWVERIIKLSTGQAITIASPLNNKMVSLVFMHLYDGNVNGSGFSRDKYKSLKKLNDGKIDSLESVDAQSHINKTELEAGLLELIDFYRPSDIHTQSTLIENPSHPDHSDHIAVGELLTAAYNKAGITIPLHYYEGYSVFDHPQNVFGIELINKEKIFTAYAKNDPAACIPNQACWLKSNYSVYLPRQYRTNK